MPANVFGAAMQQGTQTMNLGRQVAMASGLPASVAGMTIDRQCSSGLMAIANSPNIYMPMLDTAEVVARVLLHPATLNRCMVE